MRTEQQRIGARTFRVVVEKERAERMEYDVPRPAG